MRLRRCGRRRRSWPPSVTAPKSAVEEELMSEKLPYGTTMPTGEAAPEATAVRSEEHTSELQSRFDLVCRLLLEKKKKKKTKYRQKKTHNKHSTQDDDKEI